MRAIPRGKSRRFILDVSDSYVILTLTICGFVGHDLNFLIENETGNWISINGFWELARHPTGFRELSRAGQLTTHWGKPHTSVRRIL
jgi:hypothetical protein